MSDVILEVRGAEKRFGGVAAVDGVSLEVERGSITALIGPNGAGKTTLFNLISGFLRADGGTISFEGERIERRSPYEISRRGLVRTFQLTRVFRRMSVLDNMLAAGTNPTERLTGILRRAWRADEPERELREKAAALLDLVHLGPLAGAYAGALSAGQRKLLEFARALMTDPTMILLDEPLSGVNPTLALELLERIRLLRRQRGTTILFIEHDLEAVMQAADRVVVMSEGKVIADGTPEGVRTDPRVVDAYLGARVQAEVLPAAAAPGEPHLEARELAAGYGDVEVLHDVSVRIPRGALVSVIGPNGAGKSTLLRALYGLLRPVRGRVLFRARGGEAEEVTNHPPHRLTALGMNYVPQREDIFPGLSVEENLLVGAHLAPGTTRRRLQDVLAAFPALAPLLGHRAGTLSGGERRLLALSRALMSAPRVLLLDEPSAGLSPAAMDRVFHTVTEINRSGVTLVMVEQNARRALALSHRAYVLEMGRFRFEGSGADLLGDPRVVDLYLGGRGRLAEAVPAEGPLGPPEPDGKRGGPPP